MKDRELAKVNRKVKAMIRELEDYTFEASEKMAAVRNECAPKNRAQAFVYSLKKRILG